MCCLDEQDYSRIDSGVWGVSEVLTCIHRCPKWESLYHASAMRQHWALPRGVSAPNHGTAMTARYVEVGSDCQLSVLRAALMLPGFCGYLVLSVRGLHAATKGFLLRAGPGVQVCGHLCDQPCFTQGTGGSLLRGGDLDMIKSFHDPSKSI